MATAHSVKEEVDLSAPGLCVLSHVIPEKPSSKQQTKSKQRDHHFHQLCFQHLINTNFAEMKCTTEQMQRAKIPIQFRDYCAHLLIRLNHCREKTYWMPFKCDHERHSYEACQYQEYVTLFSCMLQPFLARINCHGLPIYYRFKRRKALYEAQKKGGE